MTSSPVRAGTALLEEGIAAVNFFNGRLLTGRDLGREQDARRVADARLGQATGAGVVRGLEVSTDGLAANNRLRISKGLAVSRAGQTLCLGADQVFALTPTADSAPNATQGGFGACGQLSGGTYVAGDGLYIVTLAPTLVPAGKAEVMALDPGNIRCNTDAIVEAVQFRLLRISPEVMTEYGIESNASAPAAVSRLQNALAYACFGFPELADAHRQSGVPTKDSLLQTMQARGLSDCDVPLAVVYLRTSAGLVFVDRWAVRRRLASPPAVSQNFSAWLGESLDALGEAQLAQFQEQLNSVPVGSLSALAAKDWFEWLPPAGFLDAQGARQLDWQVFLGARKPARTVPLAAGDARAVLARALHHDPVQLTGSSGPAFRVYKIDGGPWLFVRNAPNARHAGEIWLDGTRAGLPGVSDVQTAIDTLRARSRTQLVLRKGQDLQAMIAALPEQADVNLYFETDDYELAEPLIVKNLGHVTVHGFGAGSSLRYKGGPTALRIEGCRSVSVLDLALVADGIPDQGFFGQAPVAGALDIAATPEVRIARVSARCTGAQNLRVAGIVVRQDLTGESSSITRRVQISDSQLQIGARQNGIMCSNCGQVSIQGVRISAAVAAAPMRCAIAIVGAATGELRIEDNVLSQTVDGITIDSKGEGNARAMILRNSVSLDLRGGNFGKSQFGINVAGLASAIVQDNTISAEPAGQSASGAGLLLNGRLGRHLIVRDNHISGTDAGIAFAPEPASGAALPTLAQCLWMFEGNLTDTTSGKQAIECTEAVRNILRQQNNVQTQ